jgi:hypothetical protein
MVKPPSGSVASAVLADLIKSPKNRIIIKPKIAPEAQKIVLDC